jgi:CheY-specific phosphatase CheX
MQVTEQTIAGVAKDVLETMAFVLVIPGGDESAGDGTIVRATVGFEGPFGGSVSLTIPDAAVPEIVANMLGNDDGGPPTVQQQCDAVGELANVMCGNLVQALAGPEPVFRLEAPKVATDLTAAGSESASGVVTSARVPLENGWAELSLVLNGDPQ